MKTLTIRIRVPKPIRLILSQLYSEKEIQKMLKDECLEFLWDVYHALKNNKAKPENHTKKKVA